MAYREVTRVEIQEIKHPGTVFVLLPNCAVKSRAIQRTLHRATTLTTWRLILSRHQGPPETGTQIDTCPRWCYPCDIRSLDIEP